MKRSDSLDLEIRGFKTRLNELAGQDTLTDEEQSECADLETKVRPRETQYRAAKLSEDSEARAAEELDGESREYRALVAKAELGSIYAATLGHRNTDGAEAELQTHLKIGPNQIPLDLLRSEERAVTPAPTATGVTEQPVISAVFANSVGAFLGVDQPSVGAGDAAFPIIVTRPTVGGPHTDLTPVDESTGEFEAELLKPKGCRPASFGNELTPPAFAE